MQFSYYTATETGFYYLQSRYYDPVTHRFINADSYASTGQGIIGTNMFAYCTNNPVVFFDETGEDGVAIFAFICVALCVIVGHVKAKRNGYEGWGYWSELAKYTMFGITCAMIGGYAAGAYGSSAVVAGAGGATATTSTAEIITSGGGIGFEEYRQLKDYLGSAGDGYHWHHIVEQCQAKPTRAGFSAQWIQNTLNVIKLAKDIHEQVSNFYSSVPSKSIVDTGGMVFRNWLTSMSFEEQYSWGLWVLRFFGVDV